MTPEQKKQIIEAAGDAAASFNAAHYAYDAAYTAYKKIKMLLEEAEK